MRHITTALLALITLNTYAKTYIVENNMDSGVGTLRQAIDNANSSLGSDKIVFNNNITEQTIALNDEIKITDELIIEGSNNVTISGNNNSRIFTSTAPLTIKNLKLINGLAKEKLTTSHQDHGYGGAIQASADLIINNSIFSKNWARLGGAISTSHNVIITDSIFLSNESEYGGGAIITKAPLTIINSIFSNNKANDYGGVILTQKHCEADLTDRCNPERPQQPTYYDANLVISNSTFSNNSASNSGGVISAQNHTYAYGFDAFSSLNITITNSTFFGNRSITPTSENFVGSRGAVIYAAAEGKALANKKATNQTNITINSSTFSNNAAAGDNGSQVYISTSQNTSEDNSGVELSAKLTLTNTILLNKNPETPICTFENDVNVKNNSTYSQNAAAINITNSTNNLLNSKCGKLSRNNIGNNNIVDSNTTLTTLEPLADNGCIKAAGLNSTPNCARTMALKSNSLAINSGANNGIMTDQRGFIRSNIFDIGSFEYDGKKPNTHPLFKSSFEQ